MAEQVRGEQMLPGDPESLLKATRNRNDSRGLGVKRYLALSVTVDERGRTMVRKLRIDPGTRRVVPELLDEIGAEHEGAATLPQVLHHYAQRLCLDDLEDL